MTERAFVRSLRRVGLDGVTVRDRTPFGIDDCARYPLFPEDLIALMRRVIPAWQQTRVATSVVVTATKPSDGDAPADDFIASARQRNAPAGGAVSTNMSEHTQTPTFDAEDRHCGGGLQAELRHWWAGLPSATRCRVILRDPSAKADAPSLARLLGHTVEHESDEDGVFKMTVRTKGR